MNGWLAILMGSEDIYPGVLINISKYGRRLALLRM